MCALRLEEGAPLGGVQQEGPGPPGSCECILALALATRRMPTSLPACDWWQTPCQGLLGFLLAPGVAP